MLKIIKAYCQKFNEMGGFHQMVMTLWMILKFYLQNDEMVYRVLKTCGAPLEKSEPGVCGGCCRGVPGKEITSLLGWGISAFTSDAEVVKRPSE